MEISIVNNMIHFMREGEIGTISAIKEGCIRFKATASMKLSDENWTLLPDTDCNAHAWQEGNVTFLQTGNLKLRMEENGSVSYWSKDKLLIREQPEQTFGFGYRNYRSIGSGLWKIRVTFEANEQEQFYGLGHERMNVFSKKGCTVDLRHLNTKCSMPYVYSSLGYGFLWNLQ